MCHRYVGFEEAIPGNGWIVEGHVFRNHAEGKAPTKYSLPHWGARNDDRYFLVLVPVAPDSSFWATGDIEITEVMIIAEKDTIDLHWAERDPTFDNVVAQRKVLHSANGYYRKTPYSVWFEQHGLELACRRFTFTSEYFHLDKPVPDILAVEFELLILDRTTREPLSSWKVRSEAVVDRHRRWVFIDGIES